MQFTFRFLHWLCRRNGLLTSQIRLYSLELFGKASYNDKLMIPVHVHYSPLNTCMSSTISSVIELVSEKSQHVSCGSVK